MEHGSCNTPGTETFGHRNDSCSWCVSACLTTYAHTCIPLWHEVLEIQQLALTLKTTTKLGQEQDLVPCHGWLYDIYRSGTFCITTRQIEFRTRIIIWHNCIFVRHYQLIYHPAGCQIIGSCIHKLHLNLRSVLLIFDSWWTRGNLICGRYIILSVTFRPRVEEAGTGHTK